MDFFLLHLIFCNFYNLYCFYITYYITDQRECDTAINKLRSDLKIKVNELRDLELTPPVPGLMLEPMSHKEMNAIGQILGRSV